MNEKINLLTPDEKQVLKLMQLGSTIVGEKKTNEACEIWINTCVRNKLLSN